MSIEQVRKEVLRFLASPNPEVLCIRGRWGVGKTFSWKRYLGEASKIQGGISLERYAYVSLFGVNSLEELKYAVFERTVARDHVGDTANLETFKSALDSAEVFGRKNAWLLTLVPGIRTYLSGAAPALFLSVRNQLLCIDDLERKGGKLEAADVLGLVSFLKEERSCKIALLLNDEALAMGDKEKFNTYLEKVVDLSLRFEPSAEDSTRIALASQDLVSKRVKELCIALGISNIRVIKRIERDVRTLQPLINDFDEGVFEQASSSLTLFGWSHYQPADAPSLEFLTSKKSNLYVPDKDETISPTEAGWNALLNAYGYRWTDEFDLVLIDGVQNGYFDPEKVRKHASALHDKFTAAKADGSFEDAWRRYHDSFADDQEKVLDTIYASFMKNYRYISPLNLNGTVRLFKELGHQEEATKMIQHYVSNREQDKKLFDLEEYPFRGDITDPEIEEAFQEKCKTLHDKRDIDTLLLNLKDNWSDESLSELSTVAVERYYAAFKKHQGKDLRKILAGVLQFDRIANASDEMKEISRRAKEALKLIGRESPINARRVAKLGVQIDGEDTENAQAAG